MKLSKQKPGQFNFLSVFKWEQRKGWDVLLKAYFTEFTKDENVALYIHTYIYKDIFAPRDANRITRIINDFAEEKLELQVDSLPKLIPLTEELDEKQMPSLFKAADAFVLPSRGEGWGLPYMEAMAMELPTIGTNWSGNVDFMNEQNSYLIKVKKMVPASEPGFGEQAEPSVEHLRELMRHVYTNQDQAKIKGKKARQSILQQYTQEKVAEIVISNIRRIETIIAEKDMIAGRQDNDEAVSNDKTVSITTQQSDSTNNTKTNSPTLQQVPFVQHSANYTVQKNNQSQPVKNEFIQQSLRNGIAQQTHQQGLDPEKQSKTEYKANTDKAHNVTKEI